MSFTGNKDTDLMVFQLLNDKDLAKILRINKYCKNLLKDEGFWKRRLLDTKDILPHLTYKNFKSVQITEKIRHGRILQIHENADKHISKLRRYVYVKIKNMNIEGFINRTSWKKICKNKNNLLIKRKIRKGISAYDIFEFSELDYFVEFLSSNFRHWDLSVCNYIEIY